MALLCSGLVAPVAVGSDGAGEHRSDGATVTVREPSAAVGDVVELVVRFGDTRDATLSLSGAGHDAVLRLDDVDADGRAVVRVNTHLHGRRAYHVEGAADTVNASGPFEPGAYTAAAVDGDGPVDASARRSTGEANLTLTGPRVGGVRLWRGGSTVATDLNSDRTIRDAVDDGALTPAEQVVPGETVVVEVDAAGLGGAYELSRAETSRGRLGDALDAANGRVTVRSADAASDNASDPVVSDLVGAAESVVAAPERGVYYLVLDTTALGSGGERGDRDEGGRTDLLVGVSLGVDGAESADPGAAAGNPRLAFERVAVVDARATVAGAGDRTVELVPEAGVQLRGRTTLAPGTALDVFLTGPDGTAYRDRTAVAAAGNGSSFVATFDLSGVERRTDFEVAFARPDAPTERVSPTTAGTVVRVRPRAGSVELANGTLDPGTARVRASAAHDAVVGLYRRSNNSRGPLLGQLRVPAGNASGFVDLAEPVGENATLVAVLYHDVDASGNLTDADVPYRVDGRPVRDARGAPASATGTPLATTSSVTTDRTTDGTTTASSGDAATVTDEREGTATPDPKTGTTTTDSTERGTPTSNSAPGFGPTAALGALVALLLVRSVVGPRRSR